MANDVRTHLIGLLLGAEEDWPRAFESILSLVGPLDVKGTTHTFTTERVRPRERRHTQDQYLEFLEHLGVPVRLDWSGLGPTDDEAARYARLLPPHDGPTVAMIIGTMPAAGRKMMYTSGCPNSQKRCCQIMGSPPAAVV